MGSGGSGAVACGAIGRLNPRGLESPPYGRSQRTGFRMNSPVAIIVGWALVPTRIKNTHNATGNSPTSLNYSLANTKQPAIIRPRHT
jgi:hypothetical protein